MSKLEEGLLIILICLFSLGATAQIMIYLDREIINNGIRTTNISDKHTIGR